MADEELTPEEAEGIAYLEALLTEREAEAHMDRVMRHCIADIRIPALERQAEAEADLERLDEIREEIDMYRDMRKAS